MMQQAKIVRLIAFTCMLLVQVLAHISCKEKENEVEYDTYISTEDFIKQLKGEWIVYRIHREQHQPGGEVIWISLYGDSVQYSSSPDFANHTYHPGDSDLCILPYIQNFSTWTILERDNNLILETRDYCGNSNTYNIDIGYCHYNGKIMITSGGVTHPLPQKSWIYAGIGLENPDTTVMFDEFILKLTDFIAPLNCRIVENNFWSDFELCRPGSLP
jgi:hypothetical protein